MRSAGLPVGGYGRRFAPCVPVQLIEFASRSFIDVGAIWPGVCIATQMLAPRAVRVAHQQGWA
eukprot:8430691-Lingulodinium_polyedra.AAC.1